MRMFARITNDPNLNGLERQVSSQTRRALARAGLLARQIILQRVQSGKEVNGNPFTRYSDNYKEFRQEKGLPTRPDLNVTGTMLGALQVRRNYNRGYVELYFLGQEQNKKALWNDKIRPFFDLSGQEKARINQLFRFN